MNKGWHRERINPIDYLKKLGWPTEHVTYDPKMRKGDYSIIRQTTHDGTLLFTLELLERTLHPLASRTSCHKSQESEARPENMRYVVGPLRIATVYGTVKLPCSDTMRYPGERQRTRIPVRASVTVSASDT